MIGLSLTDVSVGHPWLAWLGIEPDFFMIDYWPIFPWFGVMLLGLSAGNLLYSKGNRRFALGATPRPPAMGGLTFLGRHSLLIYLVHQPILVTALVIFGVGDLELL